MLAWLITVLLAAPGSAQTGADDCTVREIAYERDSVSASQLHATAQGMKALADQAHRIAAASSEAAADSVRGSASEFYMSAAEVSALSVELDSRNGEYRLFLARLLWRVAQLGDGRFNLRVAQRAEEQASYAAILARQRCNSELANAAAAFSVDLQAVLPERSR